MGANQAEPNERVTQLHRARRGSILGLTSNWQRPMLQVLASVALMTVELIWLPACTPTRTAATVSMKFHRAKATPRDAAVYIDEQFVGLLGVVAARGVRLPAGEHRITVERDGYFPWDALVQSEGEPIQLDVQMRPIPD